MKNQNPRLFYSKSSMPFEIMNKYGHENDADLSIKFEERSIGSDDDAFSEAYEEMIDIILTNQQKTNKKDNTGGIHSYFKTPTHQKTAMQVKDGSKSTIKTPIAIKTMTTMRRSRGKEKGVEYHRITYKVAPYLSSENFKECKPLLQLKKNSIYNFCFL